ncbi:YqcC family protein [Shewanella sp. VB17]|uniref:YqcC family protein n=1 Tax=Shewanella sp. VB17 TaxID=2739432 RepID=UPI0015668266|nr:YqcC family protein [Shewanella sp. VB17]NRD73154.1 YqcC family protein [Shewanella sp. VB17]
MLYSKVIKKLRQLESELNAHGLWSKEPPSQEAMISTSPFSCDVMSFENWLQFIFIPKIYALITSNSELPSNIAIAPMAHYVWNVKPHLEALIMILYDLDNLLSEQ